MRVRIGELGVVMIDVRDVRRVMTVRSKMGMNNGRMARGVRLVHVFLRERGRDGKPRHERHDGQDAGEQSHRWADYMSRRNICALTVGQVR